MTLHYSLLHFPKENTEDSSFNYLSVTYIKCQFCVSEIFKVKKKHQLFGKRLLLLSLAEGRGIFLLRRHVRIPPHSRRAGCEFLWWSRLESSNCRWLVQFPVETLDPEALCFLLWLQASVAELSIRVFNGSGATWWTWVQCPPHHWGSIPEARG